MIFKKIAIIGTGPAGLAACFKLMNLAPYLQITMYDKGLSHLYRACQVDKGISCLGCNGICNVTSGFGGCLRNGDAIKLSRFPAGRRLRAVLGTQYDYFEREAMKLLKTSPEDYIEGNANDYSTLIPRQYPVAEISESRLTTWLMEIYNFLTEICHIRLNTRVIEITTVGNEFEITSLNKQETISERFDVVLIAVGRSGIADANNWFRNLGVSRLIGHPSIGIRVELPVHLLKPLYKIHRDFKFTNHGGMHKVKSFCFCGKPDTGGQIRYCHYQDQFKGGPILLDGCITIERKSCISGTGNFALLAQIDTNGVPVCEWLNRTFLPRYTHIFNGRPVWQPLCELLDDHNSSEDISPSVACMRRGEVDSIIPFNILTDLLGSYKLVAQFAAQRGNFVLSDYWEKAVIMAPAVEFAWDTVQTNSGLETSVPHLYTIGDSAGIAQGNLQAALGGLAAATHILKGV